jgi:hypothetical protein
MANYTSIADFNAALANVKVLLPAMMMPLIKDAETVMCREIRARVSVTGETSTGGTFSAYSPKYEKRKTKHGQTALGKKIDKKNFWFTGNMWGTFGVQQISIQGNRIVSNINFKGQTGYTSTAELNEIHSQHENQGIAYPNKEEEQLLVVEIEKFLFETLNKVL